MTSILRRLSRIGVTDHLPEREARRVAAVNVVIAAAVLIGLLMVVPIAAYLPTTWPLLVAVSVHIIWIGLALPWRHRPGISLRESGVG
jgi:hypothetical protein